MYKKMLMVAMVCINFAGANDDHPIPTHLSTAFMSASDAGHQLQR